MDANYQLCIIIINDKNGLCPDEALSKLVLAWAIGENTLIPIDLFWIP